MLSGAPARPKDRPSTQRIRVEITHTAESINRIKYLRNLLAEKGRGHNNLPDEAVIDPVGKMKQV